jgi:hypothetical protein
VHDAIKATTNEKGEPMTETQAHELNYYYEPRKNGYLEVGRNFLKKHKLLELVTSESFQNGDIVYLALPDSNKIEYRLQELKVRITTESIARPSLVQKIETMQRFTLDQN